MKGKKLATTEEEKDVGVGVAVPRNCNVVLFTF
jgi:hypothetical protein